MNGLLAPSPCCRRQAAVQLWFLNTLLATVLGSNYLAHVPEGEDPRLWLFALPALVTSVTLLTLGPGLLFLAAAHWVRWPRVLGVFQAVLWTLFQVLLYTDTRLFNIFGYHFNGQVLNLVTTRGSEDSLHLGWQVWTAVILGLTIVGGFELWLWRRALQRYEEADRPPSLFSFAPRSAWVWGAVFLPALFVEKTIYAQANLARDRQVTALARLFPLYARVPAEDLASKVLGFELDRTPRVELEGFELHYPLAVPTLDPAGPRPNVLVLVVDCLRSDLLNATNAPHMARWAESSLSFADHVSGGNSTRYGIFSLLYGLYGSYWFPFLQERRSPVLLDVLGEAGYETGVFSSASMNYPELRSTAWVRVQETVRDAYGAPEAWQRDELAAADLLAWLRQREQDEDPFFGFLLLDAPHQTYSHPPDATPFTPSAEELDYMAMTENGGPEPLELEKVRNRYLNAVHFADGVVGRVFEALESSPLLEDTVVVVTGDHGEEFWECGFFGHTSAYTREQVAVPFLLRGPGVEPGIEDRPTSHLDLAPTLLEMMGADPGIRAGWTLGENLLDPPLERRRVVSGWNELGIWTPDVILRVPLSVLEFDVEVYDHRWKLVTGDREVLQAEAETLIRLGVECNRFLRQGS